PGHLHVRAGDEPGREVPHLPARRRSDRRPLRDAAGAVRDVEPGRPRPGPLDALRPLPRPAALRSRGPRPGRRADGPHMSLDSIRLEGVTTHNLKSVDVSFPKGQLIVAAGVSGSGKSSLVIDTLFEHSKTLYLGALSSKSLDMGDGD